MPNYQNGKIYKVINDVNGMTYYGSTVQKLSKRMGAHREAYNYKHSKTYEKFGDIKDCKIFLIENYPCNSKEELERKERYYIENNDCVNITIPTRTKKEHFEINKKRILLKNAEWNFNHKKQRNKMTDCECGFQYSKCNKARHLKSKKHLKGISSHQSLQNFCPSKVQTLDLKN